MPENLKPISCNDNPPILTAAHLTKHFQRTKQGISQKFAAVDDISFTLHRGECLAVIGESGSGKSTLAKLITRLLPTDNNTDSRIILDGKDITCLHGRKLKPVYQKMQMIFQQPQESFDPRQTLRQSILEILYNYGADAKTAEARLQELLPLVNLTSDLIGRYPHQVSGGQCQRAAIARAIAVKPQILICDEATSALDVTVQKQILTLLKHLQRQFNLALLFICHDIALVQELCDNVLVMHHGKIVERGSVNQIINHPQEQYTQSLIEAAYFQPFH